MDGLVCYECDKEFPAVVQICPKCYEQLKAKLNKVKAEKNHWQEIERDLMAQVSSKDILYREQLRINKKLQVENKQRIEIAEKWKRLYDTVIIENKQLQAKLLALRWIPVPEGLPKKQKEYEICIELEYTTYSDFICRVDTWYLPQKRWLSKSREKVTHYRHIILPEQALKKNKPDYGTGICDEPPTPY